MSDYPRIIGEYVLRSELGRGAMAVVHLAHEPDLDRLVAVKELHEFRAVQPELVKRFVRESQIVASLKHPNIVTVHKLFVHDSLPYIVMEYAEGGSLQRYVGRMTLAQIAGVLKGILAGLRFASERDVTHLDVKPANVMVDGHGTVKIADFGIARALDRIDVSHLTSSGRLGTPAYMAPEQAMAEDVGPATDLYAVGTMAYEMLVGRRPLTLAGSGPAAMLAIVQQKVPRPRTVDPSLDEVLALWLERMLQKDRRDRYQSAAEAWDVLEERVIALLGPLWARDAPLRALAEGDDELAITEHLPDVPDGPHRVPPGDGAFAVTTAIVTPEPAPPADAAAEDPSGPAIGGGAPPIPAEAGWRRRRIGWGWCGLALVAAGAGGQVAASMLDAEPASSRAGTVSTATLQLRPPEGFKQVANPTPVGAVRFDEPLAVARDSGSADALVAGIVRIRDRSLLPLAQLGLRASPGRRDVVVLGGLRAYRYRHVVVRGAATPLTLYTVPSDTGAALVACPEAEDGFAARCERVARTLRVRRAQAYSLGPDAGYATRVSAALRIVDRARARQGRDLARANTRTGQRRSATRIARKLRAAARRLGRVRPDPADRASNDAIVRALTSAGRAYDDLASAAGLGAPRRYRRAASAVRSTAGALNRALRDLRRDGYRVVG